MGQDWSGFELDVEDEMACQHFRVGYGETSDIGQPTERWYYVEIVDKIKNETEKLSFKSLSPKKIEGISKLIRSNETCRCIISMIDALGCKCNWGGN